MKPKVRAGEELLGKREFKNLSFGLQEGNMQKWQESNAVSNLPNQGKK